MLSLRPNEAHNGEPEFSSINPPITITRLNSTIECGSYISFFNNRQLCYGRVIRSYVDEGNHVVVVVNRYSSRLQLEEQLENIAILPSKLTNRFISVSEIFRTKTYLNIKLFEINGIIFVFRPYAILSDLYEGSSDFFLSTI